MDICVKITRSENAAFYRVQSGSVVQVDIEAYVRGVVGSEIGNAPLEACKAQAVVARTFALPYAQKGEAISDDSSVAQAFRAPRMDDAAYTNAHTGTDATAGEVLFYGGKALATCSYSASNGGRTVSSQERWGGVRLYLIAQDDPWDLAATGGKKTGHGVGMSQAGIVYAAKQGVTYREMLAFYYPGTELRVNYGEYGEKGGAGMTARDQVNEFRKMVGWRYEWGSAKEGCVDCSGAFVYAMKKYGLSIFHGSNTIWREHLTAKGKIGEIELTPGMAVFRHRMDGGEPDKYRADGQGNFFHIGLFVGDGKVIEAKSSTTGVVESSVQGWTHCGKVKGIVYSDTENMGGGMMSMQAKVTTESGAQNLRKDKSTYSVALAKIPKGETVTVLDNSDADWWRISYNGQIGYVVTQYLTVIGGTEPSVSTIGMSIVIPCASATEATRMQELLKTAKVQ